MARYLEYLVLVAVALVVITQVLIPSVLGKPLFPIIRFREKFKKIDAAHAERVGKELDDELDRTQGPRTWN